MNSKAISSILLWQDYWPPRSKPAAEVANATPRRYSRPVVASPKHRLTAQGREHVFAGVESSLSPGNVLQRQLTARLLTDIDRSANVGKGRRPELGRLAAFRCRAALERHAERKDCRTLLQRTTWRNFIFRSPKVTSLQPQPIALIPASIQEVASRTLARPPDKNREQRGQGGPKKQEWEGCRSRGESAKPRQNWRTRQT